MIIPATSAVAEPALRYDYTYQPTVKTLLEFICLIWDVLLENAACDSKMYGHDLSQVLAVIWCNTHQENIRKTLHCQIMSYVLKLNNEFIHAFYGIQEKIAAHGMLFIRKR